MTGYSQGKHNDPADTQDRLVRVGTKYQSSAPTVADGDNVYLLVDSAGRPIIVGPASSGAASAGNPLLIGAEVDDTSPTSVDEGDVRTLRSSPEGNLLVELYKDNNALSPIAAMPGASEVKSDLHDVTSASRVTAKTPTSGKKIRITALILSMSEATATRFEMYFGTGANATTDETKLICRIQMPATIGDKVRLEWPEAGGPVGAADDVVSVRVSTGVSTACRLDYHYREE